jgi:hypothetical protein
LWLGQMLKASKKRKWHMEKDRNVYSHSLEADFTVQVGLKIDFRFLFRLPTEPTSVEKNLAAYRPPVVGGGPVSCGDGRWSVSGESAQS